jgi:hypothetical protein
VGPDRPARHNKIAFKKKNRHLIAGAGIRFLEFFKNALGERIVFSRPAFLGLTSPRRPIWRFSVFDRVSTILAAFVRISFYYLTDLQNIGTKVQPNLRSAMAQGSQMVDTVCCDLHASQRCSFVAVSSGIHKGLC